ncbi:Zinc finger CCCH domain-containing protein 58 [Hibiscus syriacus]|uniref:Zinc finger CCCH domain-containing protein 58 n=1 Tax=Hibiscus syriacus TaxID=106335 RepID=A0A6A3C364_HIBSY|nr:zinc finger CCCH domain-containing protein 34-like [Hibiscus syriacus]XP_039061249.1 zinc finger CCCH domain-containing protein 34-like [Hibiscus syriacus]KAE8723393.1 Zinc finger CCCH domain-containing protein 58 [Hibiscus syriacus]
MERGPESDPEPKWSAPGPETGLEEPGWRLELGVEPESYPERPNEVDCIYYLRTGFCGYGSRCRFNHPRDRAMVMRAGRGDVGEYPERVNQPVCQYYMRMGSCRFGSSCKYHHPKEGGGSAIHVPLNYYGYPLRSGEKECSYYVKTGRCKFGATCKFNHPAPPAVQVQSLSPAPRVPSVPSPVPAPTLYSTVQSPSGPSSQQYGVLMTRPPLMPGSYVQGPYGPFLLSPGMVPFPSWNPYPGPVSSGSQTTVGPSSIFRGKPLSPSAPAYTGSYQSVTYSVGPSRSNLEEQQFPERPGQPECRYYMKTGDCKYGSSCRYHHPPEVIAPKGDVILCPLGLPLRPGEPTCTHFSRRGVCKFGPACKFDHPMEKLSYSPSTSSVSDMPVPYPLGSMIGTLAPSSSSLNLRPELLSGSIKDPAPTIMSSSVSSLSESVGSGFPKGTAIPHSITQQSTQCFAPPTGSGSTEAHTSS